MSTRFILLLIFCLASTVFAVANEPQDDEECDDETEEKERKEEPEKNEECDEESAKDEEDKNEPENGEDCEDEPEMDEQHQEKPEKHKGDNAQYECGAGSKLTVAQKKAIVDKHNELRSKLAKGLLVDTVGNKMPGAKNMRQIRWNCNAEKRMQLQANACGKIRGVVAGQMPWYGTSTNPSYVATLGVRAAESWWSELTDGFVLSSDRNVTMNVNLIMGGASNWAQMAWGKTFEVGCGYNVCDNQMGAFITCLYSPPGGTYGQSVYEIGMACTKDNDCDTGKCNKENGLCL